MNKQFYATAQLVAHRRKTITYNVKTLQETQNQIQTWLQNPFVLRNIRHLTLRASIGRNLSPTSGPFPKRVNITQIWTPVVELVTKAARLVKVNFDFPSAEFPLALLQALQTYHPKVGLYLWNYYRSPLLDHKDAAEQALAVSPILRGIRANAVVQGGGTTIDLRNAAFQRIVANAPHLEYASISVRRSGCLIRRQRPEDKMLEQEAAAKFFPSSFRPNTSIRKLTLDGFGLSKTTLTEWGQYVSLSHLQDLKWSSGLPDHTFFEAAPSLLTNLKHVSLNLSSGSGYTDPVSLVDDYLATCAPLETLSLWGWMEVVTFDTIMKHGVTLKKLELHQRESLSHRRGVLSVEDVRRIRNECPRLVDLTLDMDRENADWHKDLEHHQEMLKEIAQLGERLRRVQIYLDLGIVNLGPLASRRNRDTDGLVSSTDIFPVGETADNATEPSESHSDKGPFSPLPPEEMKKHGVQLWKMIFGDPTRTGPRDLDVKWGEWEREIGRGYPARWVTWERAHKAFVIVRPEERDDMPGQAVARILRKYVGGCERDD